MYSAFDAPDRQGVPVRIFSAIGKLVLVCSWR